MQNSYIYSLSFLTGGGAITLSYRYYDYARIALLTVITYITSVELRCFSRIDSSASKKKAPRRNCRNGKINPDRFAARAACVTCSRAVARPTLQRWRSTAVGLIYETLLKQVRAPADDVAATPTSENPPALTINAADRNGDVIRESDCITPAYPDLRPIDDRNGNNRSNCITRSGLFGISLLRTALQNMLDFTLASLK